MLLTPSFIHFSYSTGLSTRNTRRSTTDHRLSYLVENKIPLLRISFFPKFLCRHKVWQDILWDSSHQQTRVILFSTEYLRHFGWSDFLPAGESQWSEATGGKYGILDRILWHRGMSVKNVPGRKYVPPDHNKQTSDTDPLEFSPRMMMIVLGYRVSLVNWTHQSSTNGPMSEFIFYFFTKYNRFM